MAESYSVRAVLSAYDKGFSAAMKNAGSATDSLAAKLKSGLSFGVFAGIGQSAFNAVTNSAKSLIGEIDSSNAAWKTFNANMSMLGKNSKEIDKVKGELQSFAQETIYSSSDMASTFAQLEAVGTKNTLSLVKAFGGLAAAAENPQQAMKTLSMQATQMAAKPKVAWEDFKLILEQTPAGVAAVAKEMGMSTQDMVTAVQEGKVKTEDFFDAISKVGTNKAFSKLATEAKTTGQAMDGLKETLGNKLTPAFDVLSKKGISAIEGITKKLEGLDGGKIAEKVSAGLDFVIQKFNSAKKIVTDFAKSIADTGAFSAAKTALVDIGNAIKSVFSSLSESVDLNAIAKVIGNIVKAASKAASAISKFVSSLSQKELTAVVGGIAAAVAGFKAFNFLKSFNPFGIFRRNSEEALDGVSGSARSSGSLVVKVFNGISKTIDSLGKGIADSAKGIGTGLATAFKGIGAAIKMVRPAQLIALGAAIAIVAAGFALLATQSSGVAEIITSIGTAIAEAAPFVEAIGNVVATILTAAITAVANALMIIAPIIPIIASAIVSLSPLVTALAQAFALVASAVGSAISQIITAIMPAIPIITDAFVQIAAVIANAVVQIIQAIQPVLPAIIDAFTQIATVIANAIVSIVQAIAPYTPCLQAMIEATSTAIQAVCDAFTVLAQQIAPIIESVTQLIQQLGDSITQILGGVSDIVTSVGDTIANVFESIGGAISSVIDSIAGVFDSLGNAALNAGTGFEKLANGVSIIVGLPILDMVASLGALAGEMVAIAACSIGMSDLGNAMEKFSAGLLIVSQHGLTAAQAFVALSGTVDPLVSTIPQLAPAFEQAGASIKTFAAGAMIAMASLVTSASSASTFTTTLMAVVAAAAASSATIQILSAAAQRTAAALNTLSSSAKTANFSMKSISSGATELGATLNKLSNVGKQALKALSRAFLETAKDATRAGKETGSGFTEGLMTGLLQAPVVAMQIVTTVTAKLKSGHSGAYEAGAYISQGFAQGMLSQLSIVQRAAAQLAAAADAAIRAKAKIHSPSKVAEKEGGFFGSGWVNGILGKVKEAWRASEKLVQMPKVETPEMRLAYAGGLPDEYEYSRNSVYTIVVPVEIDGKEVAKVTAPYTQAELNKRQKHEDRKRGRV